MRTHAGRIGALAILAAGLAACAPAPPFEEVTDPFAAPPAATSAPLQAPGVVQITPLAGPGSAPTAPTGPITPAQGPLDVVTETNPGGLVERLPNTCRLENYQQFQGQDGTASAAQVFDRPTRVIGPDDIVSQVYDPQRVNFYTNAAGRVTRISCG